MLQDKIILILDISDSTDMILIETYINQAKLKIKNYLNLGSVKEVEKIEGYEEAILDYVMTMWNVKGYEGFKQYSEGGMNVTLKNSDGLPESTRALLPKPVPRIRMM